jgi:hypothetical protein
MPVLGERFKTFDAFGSAELSEIYTTELLQKSHRVEATTLESGLLVNDGQGQFQFQPLPRIAQIAPGFGCELWDANLDGWLDLYLAQNFYSPQRETGHMDGGVSMLLLGDGRCGWQPVWPDASGLVVGGDAKSVVATDLNSDGRTDLLVGVNHGQWQAFQAAPVASGRHALQVKLQGSSSNPTGVGAWVRLLETNERSQLREVRAGGGYLSQASSAVCFAVPSDRDHVQLEVRWPDGKSSRHEVAIDRKSTVTRARISLQQ